MKIVLILLAIGIIQILAPEAYANYPDMNKNIMFVLCVVCAVLDGIQYVKKLMK